MPSVSSAKSPEGAGVRRPDVVLGDGNGTTCDPWLTQLAREVFADAGYGVALNVPYNGADLIRAQCAAALQHQSDTAAALRPPAGHDAVFECDGFAVHDANVSPGG